MARKPQVTDDASDVMFTLGEMPEDPNAQQDDQPGQKPAQPGSVTLTAEQFAELTQGSEERIARALAGLGGSPAAGNIQPGDDLPDLTMDLSGLPDPSEDLAGFLKGFGERTTTVYKKMRDDVANRATQAGQTARNQQQVVDAAWADFAERYEDVADFNDLTNAAVARYSEELRAQGRDPGRELTTNSRKFVDAVGKRVRAEVARIRGEDADAAEGRTEGLVPDRGGNRQPRQERQNARVSNFVDELKGIQTKLRYY